MVESYALEQVKLRLIEGVPFQLFEQHIVSQVDAQVCSGCYCPASVFEFFFVDVDRDVCVCKMLKTSSMVKVQVANDDRFHIFDIIPSGFDSIWELMVFGVFSSRKEIRDWGWPFLYFGEL
jgi:hypothetical protein